MRQMRNLVQHVCNRLQVADFMDDRAMVDRDTDALGRACYLAGRSDEANSLGGAILGLPLHLQHAVFGSLVAARELPDLLDTLPAALHCALLIACTQYGSDEGFRADSNEDLVACGDRLSDRGRSGDDVTARERALHLRYEEFSASAFDALIACIPHMPPLGAIVCDAALPAADLTHALTAHSTLTRLDLVGAIVAEAELGADALASALPSWPRLASLRLPPCIRWSATAPAAASDLLAPALADASALTSLDVSWMPLTPELARAVGALKQLAELRLKSCIRVQEAMPLLATLPRLRILEGPSTCGVSRLACMAALCGIASCRSLLHLDLWNDISPGYDLAGFELTMLPLLQSLRLWNINDSSLRQPGSSSPIVTHDPACRHGVRALPHLLQLTSLLVQFEATLNIDDDASDTAFEACALGAALPLLTRLARLDLRNCECEPSGFYALQTGWSCAPALRALTCTLCGDATVDDGVRASDAQLCGLISLAVSIRDGLVHELDGRGRRTRVPWLSDHASQLSALHTLSIDAVDDETEYLAVLPVLSALSAVTGLRRLEIAWADMEGADWGCMPLRALSVLCLRRCIAPDIMSAVAQNTQLSRLRVFECGLAACDLSAFVQQRGHVLAGAPVPLPHLDLDLRGGYSTVTDAVVKELLDAAERLGLRHVYLPTLARDASALVAIAAFNKWWGRQRKCTHNPIVASALFDE